MKKLLSLLTILFVLGTFAVQPYVAYASGVTFDSATAAQNFGAAATTLTWTHTVTGANPTLIVEFITLGGTNSVTSVTYNSVAMTQKIAVNDPANGDLGNSWLYAYVLPNAPTGAHSVVITSSVATNPAACSISYTGTDTTTQPDGSNSATATVTTTADTPVSITTSFSGTWGVAFGAEGRSFLAGTGATMRVVNSNNQSGCIDSTSAFASTGANHVNYQSNASGGQNATVVIVGVKPFLPTPVIPGDTYIFKGVNAILKNIKITFF